MAPPIGSSLSSPAFSASTTSSTSSSSAAGVVDWHTIAIYFICLFAGAVLVILLMFCIPHDILTRPLLLFRRRAATQRAKQQEQPREQHQRPTISIPLQELATSNHSSSSSSSFSYQSYDNPPPKSKIPNPHPFGSASWRDHEAHGATPAETAALEIESLQNQLEILHEALDYERAALELVEGRNRELSVALGNQKKQRQRQQQKQSYDDYDYDLDAVDPEVLERVSEKIHQPLEKPLKSQPKIKTPTAAAAAAPPLASRNHPQTYPQAQQQDQQRGYQLSPTSALSPLARHPLPFSLYTPDDDHRVPQHSARTTTTTPPPSSPLQLHPKQTQPSSRLYAYAQRYLHRGRSAGPSVDLEVAQAGSSSQRGGGGGVTAQGAVVVCTANTVGEERSNPFADPAGRGV